MSSLDSFTLKCYEIKKEILRKIEKEEIRTIADIWDFIEKNVNLILSKFNRINKTFAVDIGWIQLFELKSKDYRDWGKVYYLFPLGDRILWDKHCKLISDEAGKSISFPSILEKLFSKGIAHERIYYDENISTNFILKKRIKNAGFVFEIISEQSAYLEPFLNLGVPIKGKDDPTKKFIIIHLGIWDCDEAKGFLTLRLKKISSNKRRQKEIIEENFINCKATLAKEEQEQIEGKNFYELEPESVLNKSIKIFAEIVILPITNLSKDIWAKETNKKDIEEYFRKDFISLIDTNKGNFNKIKILEPILNEFLEYVNNGYANSEELAMKMFYELFANRFKYFFTTHSDTVRNSLQIFDDLKKSQEALFWIPEYRDHFIHSIKVFLIGCIILSIIVNDSKVADFFERNKLNDGRLQFSWACISCFHDFAISIQKINPLIRRLISRFMFKVEEELKNEIPDIISGNHLVDSHSISVLKLIKISERASPINISLDTYDDILKKKLIDDISFRYLKRKADHGVASAISFITYALLDFLFNADSSLEEFLKDRIKIITKEVDKLNDIYEFGSKDATELIELYLTISKAILKHNLIFDDEIKHSLRIDFVENPLGFLLILIDNLQDWGRPSYGTLEEKKENFCIVKKIKYEKSGLILYLNYGDLADRAKISKWWESRMSKLLLGSDSPIEQISLKWDDNLEEIKSIVKTG
jgi:hypothetical protein